MDAMKLEILGWFLVLTIVFIAGLLVAASRISSRHHFIPDPRNPYRRTCKHCGSRHEQMHFSDSPQRVWWENTDNYDPDCVCNDYTQTVLNGW